MLNLTDVRDQSAARRPVRRAFTLIEMMVAATIVVVIGTITVAGIVQGMQVSRDMQDRVRAFEELQVAIQRVGREIRAADPIVLDPDGDYHSHIGAEVYRNEGKVIYEFTVVDNGDGTKRLESVKSTYTNPDDTTPSSVSTDVLVDLIPADADEVFRYYDADGVEIPDGSSSADYLTASQIQVTLTREVPKDNPVQVSTRLNIRNTRRS